MSTIIMAIAVLVFIGLITGLFLFILERKKNRNATRKMKASDHKDLL